MCFRAPLGAPLVKLRLKRLPVCDAGIAETAVLGMGFGDILRKP